MNWKEKLGKLDWWESSRGETTIDEGKLESFIEQAITQAKDQVLEECIDEITDKAGEPANYEDYNGYFYSVEIIKKRLT